MMNIFTMYVGQGELVVVRHAGQAIIVDASFAGGCEDDGKRNGTALQRLLQNHKVPGLILTSFDTDHCDPDGVEFILSKFAPDWVMYPKYFKETDSATAVFNTITRHERKRQTSPRPLRRVSVRVDRLASRLLSGLAANFEFELFSPHIEDKDHSNNSSIVLKLTGIGPSGFSYLITGDTENDRWEQINRFYGTSLKSSVLSAPHHGSRGAANAETLLHISPNTVLISAGVDSQYGHPNSQAIGAYQLVAKHVFATNVEGGVSLFTEPNGQDFQTVLVR
jgi:beta-lactamase superfamily II metal-dependent hydrolase